MRSIVVPILLGLFVVLAGAARARGAEQADLVGLVEVTSDPAGADVLINDEVKGKTPMLVKDVPIGQVRVAVRMAGFAQDVRMLKLEPGKTLRAEFKLTRLEGVGTIRVQVTPEGSDVFLNYAAKGKTPCDIINVAAGTYTVRVTRDGYVPFEAQLTVKAGGEEVVKGALASLKEGGRPAGPAGGPSAAGAAEGQVSEKEEAVFKDVRECIRRRDYGKAEAALREMLAKADLAQYRPRMTRDLACLGALKEILASAGRAVADHVGQDGEWTLRNGIRLKGTLRACKEGVLELDMDGTRKDVALADLDGSVIGQLAAEKMDTTKPETHAVFAIFYTAEGDYRRADRSVMLAAGAGTSVPLNLAEIKSYLAAEKAWAAQVEQAEKDRQEALRKEREAKAAKEREEREKRLAAKTAERREAEKVVVLVDFDRSLPMTDVFSGALEDVGVEIRRQTEVNYDKLDDVDVLYFHERPWMKPFTKEDITAIRKFVEKGGSILYVGRHRARTEGDDATKVRPEKTYGFDTLMGMLGVDLETDSYFWTPRTRPADIPRRVLPAEPYDHRSPINAHVRQVWVADPSSSIRPRRGDILLRIDKWGDTTSKRSGKPVYAVAIENGKSRIVVLSGPVDIESVSAPRGKELDNDGKIFFTNALKWVCGVMSRKPVKKPATAEP